MNELKNLSVLVIHHNYEQASRLISVLDNIGYVVHAHQATSLEELNQTLNSVSLDLILSEFHSNAVPPNTLLSAVNALFKDVPVIFVNPTLDVDEVAQCIKLGGKDMVIEDHDQHLIAVVLRELQNLQDRIERREIERRYHTIEKRCQDLLQDSQRPTAIIHDSMLVFANSAFADFLGYAQDELECLPVFDILSKQGQSQFKSAYKEFSKAPDSFPESDYELALKNREGEELIIQAELGSIKFNDESCLELGVTPQGVDAESSESTVTLIPRHKLIQAINRAIHTAHQSHRNSGLLCVRMDQFTQISTELGIDTAEELLHSMISRLRTVTEEFPLALFEDNVLTILIPQRDVQETTRIADQICKVIAASPITIDEMQADVSCSIGINMINDLSTNTELILKQAMEACTQACTPPLTGNGFKLFQSELDHKEIDFHQLLEMAFAEEHIQMLFQPMEKLNGKAIPQYSVLIGIKQEFAEQYPDNFIQMASRNRENHDLDRWVILGALRTLIQKTLCSGNETLHIQISRPSLQDSKFIGWLTQAIQKSKLPAHQLVFQLRELDVSTHLDTTRELLSAIHSLGAKACISQFGLTLQPVKILESLPFDCVKIDGSLSLAAQKTPEELAKLDSLIGVVAKQGKTIIVPMIETAQILPHLWKAKVGYIEGYYIGMPMPQMTYRF